MTVISTQYTVINCKNGNEIRTKTLKYLHENKFYEKIEARMIKETLR